MGWGEYKYIYIKYMLTLKYLKKIQVKMSTSGGRVCLKLRKELQAGNRNFTAHKGEWDRLLSGYLLFTHVHFLSLSC